ncbi:MAG: hypothetical protein HYZ81_21185 [Nitrospinae bacterium]|nr:hypothetical protein [Nitrospinota bacterium]
MDERIYELTWELKRLQVVVDRALEAVRPLRQAADTMVRELWQARQRIAHATGENWHRGQPRSPPGGPLNAILDLEAPLGEKFAIVFNQMMWCTTALKLLFTNDATVSREACWEDDALTEALGEVLVQLSPAEQQDVRFVLGVLLRYATRLQEMLELLDSTKGSA